MLFPLARFNLATFLKEPTPIQDKAHVTWLFQQLFDLTDAVDQVHTLAPLDSDQPNGNAADQLPPRKTGGFHHDLKPANILAFYDAEESRPVLKITDFGIAKLDIVLERSRSQGQGQGSYRSQHFAGDPIYGAPDFSQHNEAGRKADIWSLGCCFLEILLWNFGYGGIALDDFFQARYKQPPGSRGSTAAYWYYDQRLRTVALKPAVTDKLKELQRICFQKGQFQTLIRQIEFMLTIKPDERRPASVFRSAFKAMLQQAQVDLTEDADFYQRPGYVDSSRTTFAPVTEEYTTSSRRNSIDDRQVNAPFGPPASPITTSQQHYRSLSNSSATSKFLQVNTHDSANYGGQFHLSPKGDSPSRGRSRTPSIEISDYTFSNGQSDPGSAIIGALHEPPNREEIPIVRRPKTPSVKSKTL
jgi:serine/threonine protein kinase